MLSSLYGVRFGLDAFYFPYRLEVDLQTTSGLAIAIFGCRYMAASVSDFRLRQADFAMVPLGC
jgi:hypothetical protein